MTKWPFFTINIIKVPQVVGAVTKALAVDDKKEAILVRGTIPFLNLSRLKTESF